MSLVRRLHTYLGLLTLVNLVVYGVTAVYGALHWQRFGETTVEYADYRASSGETDRQTAEHVVARLGLTLATPVQSAAIQHDPSGKLLLDFYHANGRHKVTVLPDEHRLRIEATRNSFARYADILHMTTAAFRSGDWHMQLWAYYNEVALWCFVGMLMSAAWMAVARFRNLAGCWSSVMARLRTVHMSAGVVVFPFAVIFAVSSIQMAHRKWFAATGAVAWANGLHRSNRWMAGATAVCFFMLAATGLYLWFAKRQERTIGTLLAVPAGSLALALIVSMRAC